MPVEVQLTSPNGLKYTQPVGLFINNEFVVSSDNESISNVDPATGEPITDIYAASELDVDKAVKAARKASETWKFSYPGERSALLYKFCDLLEENLQTLATIEAWDSGKIYDSEALGEIQGALQIYKYFAGWADKLPGGDTYQSGKDKLAYTVYEPYGVCGQIIPWNYPFLMATWKLAPALATGNCVVLKVAENTPMSLLYTANLFKQAGFAPGVVNIFSGHGRIAGAALAGHTEVDKIAFTGSTATGKTIMKLAANNLKAVTLECGGKSPLIVCEDADLDKAVTHAFNGIMPNRGQTCTALSRCFVQDTVYDKFCEKYRALVLSKIVAGNPFDKNVTHGPQISKIQQEKVLSYIEKGKQEGGEVIVGEADITIPDKQKNGFYVHPTLFGNVQDDMTIMKEEIFGPVVAIAKFSSVDEAIRKANDSIYGLGAAIFTSNVAKAHKIAAQLESGQVWINSSNTVDMRVPFGGYKMSGIGRELGHYGLETYMQVKAVHVNLEE